MDFIEAFPKIGGKSVILTVVDRLSKYAHFIPLAHPYSATMVAHKFFSEIVRLHGLPKSIVRQGCRLHQQIMAGTTDDISLPPSIRWPIRDRQQNHHYVPALLDRRQTQRMDQMASLGRILLQHCLP